MEHACFPKPKTLFIVWLLLLAATSASMVAGKAGDVSSPGLGGTGLLLLVTWIKARLIMSYFLDLKSASHGWNVALNALVITIILVIFGLYGLRLVMSA